MRNNISLVLLGQQAVFTEVAATLHMARPLTDFCTKAANMTEYWPVMIHDINSHTVNIQHTHCLLQL